MLWLYTRIEAIRATRDRGATAAEYALIITLVAVAIIAVVGFFGNAIISQFQEACTVVSPNTNCGPAAP